jgi:hypothetical protein
MTAMAWGDDEERDQDGVYGIELIVETGGETGSRAFRELDAGRRETIGGHGARRLPRILRVVGLLAALVTVTIAVWPSGTGPKPAPPAAVRIRVAGTRLAPTSHDATLTLVLANDAPSSASVGEAEILDAAGRRIGAHREWPAGDIAAGSTLAVDIPVPYVCDAVIPRQIDLPVALHVSVSSALDPSALQHLSYPLDAQAWQNFEQYQSGACDSANSTTVKVGAISVAGTDPAARSIKILIPVSASRALTVYGIFATNQAFRAISDPAPPLPLPSSGPRSIAMTLKVSDCGSMAGQWDKNEFLILSYEGPAGGTSVTVSLPAPVIAQLAATACPA